MVQLPVEVSDDSEPEPDFAIVPKLEADETELRPLLAIEVADSSLKLDLGPKARLYAEAKIAEYWVLDLAGRTTVVHRTPRAGKYASVRRVPWSKPLSASTVPGLTVQLSAVLHR